MRFSAEEHIHPALRTFSGNGVLLFLPPAGGLCKTVLSICPENRRIMKTSIQEASPCCQWISGRDWRGQQKLNKAAQLSSLDSACRHALHDELLRKQIDQKERNNGKAGTGNHQVIVIAVW